MKIVLLEGLGVSEEIIRKQTKKLNEMGHEFVIYEKIQIPGCRQNGVKMQILSCLPICH